MTMTTIPSLRGGRQPFLSFSFLLYIYSMSSGMPLLVNETCMGGNIL